jgi:GH18 family chitinase
VVQAAIEGEDSRIVHAPGARDRYPASSGGQKPAEAVALRGSYRAALALLSSGFTPHELQVDGRLSAVFAYDAAARQWISYDDAASMAAKADFAVTRHLAGMMMWEIGEDAPVGSPESVLRSAHAALSR